MFTSCYSGVRRAPLCARRLARRGQRVKPFPQRERGLAAATAAVVVGEELFMRERMGSGDSWPNVVVLLRG